MNGLTPPRMIPVVVEYAAVLDETLKALLSNTRLGLISAALYGPRNAMKPTWIKTAHLSHDGQFCRVTDQYSCTMITVGMGVVYTDQWIVFEATGLRHQW